MSRLIVVPTPIGNLGDITQRSIDTLKSVDLILAEDTRVTRRILSHFQIESQMQAYHQHNEHKSVERVVDVLQSGKSIALVSDAGTPGISDPAFLLVRACVEAGIDVECLPGATAFVPALVVSGLPCDRFVFEGFLPHKKGRQKRLEALIDEERTIVFYESPYRVVKLLEQMIDVFGEERKISVSREISKLYEEHKRGTLAEVLTHLKSKDPKGEFVVVLAGKS
jgi:16S rRNA (cytidine1402-2'-O)-methyltransferase